MGRREFPNGRMEQFIVRFPDGLRDEIKLAAAQSGRSMNAEIIARIETGGDRRTLRDEFAGQIAASMWGSVGASLRKGPHDLASDAAVFYHMADAMLEARGAGFAPAADGYTEAFYEIAAMLGIGAKPYSPKEAFERDIKPRLEALLAAERGEA